MSTAYDKESFVVPTSIRLLFNNDQLDMIKTLCLLYALLKKSKTKFNKVNDIVFYYSLVNFDMARILKAEEVKEDVSRNLYYRFQQNINQIILELSNLEYVEVRGNTGFKMVDLGIRLTKEGHDFIEGLDIDYFSELINEYSNAISIVDNNSENKNKLKGGG